MTDTRLQQINPDAVTASDARYLWSEVVNLRSALADLTSEYREAVTHAAFVTKERDDARREVIALQRDLDDMLDEAREVSSLCDE